MGLDISSTSAVIPPSPVLSAGSSTLAQSSNNGTSAGIPPQSPNQFSKQSSSVNASSIETSSTSMAPVLQSPSGHVSSTVLGSTLSVLQSPSSNIVSTGSGSIVSIEPSSMSIPPIVQSTSSNAVSIEPSSISSLQSSPLLQSSSSNSISMGPGQTSILQPPLPQSPLSNTASTESI